MAANHYFLSSLSKEEQYNDIIECKNFLESYNIKRSNVFCLPFGGINSYNDDTVAILRELNYRSLLLTENKLRAGIFEVELFKRLVKPISLLAMILIAMLFIFGSTRDITLGRKIFLGVAIGLTFELISRISGALSLSYEFSPFLSSFIPSLLAIIIAVMILIKKSTHS